MKELISKKLEEFRAVDKSDPRIRKWLHDSDQWFWMYTVMKLTGRPLSRYQILSILKGELDENLPLDVYEFLHSCSFVCKDMEECIGMQQDPDVKLLMRWYGMAFNEEFKYRTRNPVVYQWNYVPCHFLDVPANVEQLLKKNALQWKDTEPVERACRLMLEFLRIYPFDDDSLIMASFLVMYELMRGGVPIPSLTAGEQEFNDLAAAYLGRGEEAPMMEMFERSVLNRLEAVITVCRQAAEEN